MAVSRERFDQGLTYDQYKQQLTRNQERFAQNERDVQITPQELEPFASLSQPLNVLVLGEDWCTDVINNLPILGRLAQESGKLNLRVFPRDQNLDLMDQYLKEGKYRSIPAFVFFDQDFNEIGRFIERPGSVTERNAQKRQQLFAEHPEWGSPETEISQMPEAVRTAYMQALADWRAQSKQQDNQDVIRDLIALIAPVRA